MCVCVGGGVTDSRGVHNFEDTTGEFDPFIIRILPAGSAPRTHTPPRPPLHEGTPARP